MRTVLTVCPFAPPNLGGVESHISKLIKYLTTARGWRVILLTYQPLSTNAHGPRLEIKKNLEIHRLQWFGRGWFAKLEKYPLIEFLYLFPGLFLKSLFFYLKRSDEIDCIHAHGFIAAAIVKVLTKIKYCWSVMSTHAIYGLKPGNRMGRLARWILKDFNRILAVGEPSKQELEGLGLKNVKVHPNWIDLNKFKPYHKNEAKKILHLKNDVVLFIGRFLEKKGVKLLLEAAKLLPSTQFIFVGDGPMQEEVTRAASLFKNINYAGKLFPQKSHDFNKLLLYYSAADIFASPVLYEEGFATVYLEAIACGTPTLTTRRGCLPYFLDKTVAIFVKPDVEYIVNILTKIFKNRYKLNQMKAACRPFALKHFSEKNAGIIYQSYYS